MNPVSQVLVLVGSVIALIASIGLVRFSSTYARLHAAGKASPISFLLIAAGCGIELGVVGGLQLVVAAIAVAITLPAATHLLFRAVHRSSATSSAHLSVDELHHARSQAEVSTARDRRTT